MNIYLKIVSCFISFLFVSLHSSAQIEKGTWMIGGNVSAFSNSASSKDTSSLSSSNGGGFNISPQIGYFITKNILIGASLGYSFREVISETNYNRNVSYVYTTNNTNKIRSQSLVLGGLASYYLPLNDRIYFNTYLKLNYTIPFYSYQTYSYTNSDGSNFVNSSDNSKVIGGVINVAIEPGISFFLTPKLALEANLGILNYSYSFNNDSRKSGTYSNSSFNFGINSISLGIRYFIPKKV